MMNRRRTARCCWPVAVAVFCFLSTEVLGDCGIPPSINNTKLKPEYVDKETFPSGSVASYLCDNTKKYGKKPGLSDTITCEGSTWSTIPVFCELTCDFPPRFAYAALRNEFTEMNIYPVGISVSYQCRPGYKPIRGMPSSITCRESLTWSVVEPFCERISCGSPGEIINGNVHLEDNLFGSTATFSCNEGYQLVGRPARQCINTGAWTNAVPSCDAVICASPENIEGGVHSGMGKDEFSYLSSVKYSCTSDSLTLIGEESIHCTQYGNWSGIPPKCKVVSCPDQIVENGKKISGFGHTYKYRLTIQFECNPGFVLVGSDIITCREDSTWVPPAPTCQVATTTTRVPDVTERSTTKSTQTTHGIGSTSARTIFGIKTQITTVETTKGKDEHHEEDGSNAALIGGILGGLFCLVVLGAVCYVCKKKKEGVYNTNESSKDVPLNHKVTPTSQSAESDKILQ